MRSSSTHTVPRGGVVLLAIALTAALLGGALAGTADAQQGSAERIDGGAQPGDVRAIAIETCQTAQPEDGSVGRVLLSRDDAFADALAGSALAGLRTCVLFTEGGPDAALDQAVRAEIDRATGGSGEVSLLGGTQAVSQAVEDELEAAGYLVQRFAGATRYETAVEIAKAAFALNYGGQPEGSEPFVEVLLAYGGDWPDAVTAGAYAAAAGAPVVLTPTEALHPATAEFLDGRPVDRTSVIGGTAVISDAAAQAAPSQHRFAGPNRMGTATAIAEALWPTAGASGSDFVFANLEHAQGWTLALAAAPLSAARGAPQLGVGNERFPSETAEYLESYGTDDAAAVLLGDAGFITTGVEDEIRARVGAPPREGCGESELDSDPPSGATRVEEAHGDLDGNGVADRLVTYALEVGDGPDEFFLRITLDSGYVAEAELDADAVADVRPLGASTIGRGRPAAFVIEQARSGGFSVALWGLHDFDDDPCSLGRVTVPDHTVSAHFPVGDGFGLQCRDFIGDGVPELVERSIRDEGGGTWAWEETAHTWDGAGALGGEGDEWRDSGTLEDPDDEERQAYQRLDCPGVEDPTAS